MPERRYDLIIAGGGASGMSLACHLLDSPLAERSLLVVDRDPRDDDQRTFSFWSRHPTVFDDIAVRRWKSLDVHARGLDLRLALDGYTYLTVRGADFQRHARGLVRACPTAEMREGTVEEIRDEADGAAVRIDGEWVRASWVFDSVPRRSIGNGAAEVVLRQRFRGWEIEAEEGVFDPEAATFFDFRVSQEGAPRFFYVLPFSERRALVEHVVYGRGLRWDALKQYVEETLGIQRYRVLYDEAGASPLSIGTAERRGGRHVMRIGVRGGRLKASTGYAFVPIVRDSAAIVASLQSQGHPWDVPSDRRLFRLLDALMLRVMASRPEVIEAAFEGMFSRNPIGRVLRFLDEEASLREVLGLGISLPLGPFVWEMLRWMAGRPVRQARGRASAATR